ncbi:hypothetical protein [Methylophaga sp.]|jgi:hypothetical protein|uniref:hypothetical protein n=1 Tax=Methylophaga sp. TaxID=2024840 RepID=UPI0013FF7AB8|nr:hypothetical protein [Methylophaga sp.]MTI63129.1 hypothetical protein [Methylophaga sp.]
MQINSNRPADFYPLVPVDNRNSARAPVIFDVEQINTNLSPDRADNTSVVVAPNSSEDGQQARFVRNFISSDRRFDGDNEQTTFLPRAVQQYLYINELPRQSSVDRGQFLDEMV